MKKILKFGAPWCGPCRLQDRILDELTSEGHNITKINVDDENILTESYHVQSVPTLIVLDDDTEIARFVGLTQKKDLLEALS